MIPAFGYPIGFEGNIFPPDGGDCAERSGVCRRAGLEESEGGRADSCDPVDLAAQANGDGKGRSGCSGLCRHCAEYRAIPPLPQEQRRGAQGAPRWGTQHAWIAQPWMSNCSGWRAGSLLIRMFLPTSSSNSTSQLALLLLRTLTVSGLTRSRTSAPSKCFFILRSSV